MPLRKGDLQSLAYWLKIREGKLGPGRLAPVDKRNILGDISRARRIIEYVVESNGVRLYPGATPTFSLGEWPINEAILELKAPENGQEA